jgi:hypothetical protein
MLTMAIRAAAAAPGRRPAGPGGRERGSKWTTTTRSIALLLVLLLLLLLTPEARSTAQRLGAQMRCARPPGAGARGGRARTRCSSVQGVKPLFSVSSFARRCLSRGPI